MFGRLWYVQHVVPPCRIPSRFWPPRRGPTPLSRRFRPPCLCSWKHKPLFSWIHRFCVASTCGAALWALFLLPAVLVTWHHVCLSGSIRGYGGGGMFSHCAPGFWVTVSPHRPADSCYCSHQLLGKAWRMHAQSLCTGRYEDSSFQLVNGSQAQKQQS